MSSNTNLRFPSKLLKTTVNTATTDTKCVNPRKHNDFSKKISVLVFYLLIFNGLNRRMKATHELITMFPYNTKSRFNSDILTKLLNRQSTKRCKRSSLKVLTLYCIYLRTFCQPNISFGIQMCEVPNEQYIVFLKAFDMWKSRRLHLLNESKAYIDKLDKIYQRFSIAQSIMSVFNIMESIVQLLINPDYKFIRYGCCFGNVALTVAETVLYKKFLIDMAINISDERELFKCLVLAMPQNLGCKIQNEISHRIEDEEEAISQLQECSIELSDDVVCYVMSSFCTGMAFNLPKNKVSKCMLKLWQENAVASLLVKRLISSENSFDLEINKIAKKKNFNGIQLFLFQAPVLGGIFLNILNIYESFFHISQGAKSSYSDTLIHFKSVIEHESEVINSIEEVRPSDFNI